MSDKVLAEIFRRTADNQILRVILNDIDNTRIHSRKQLGSCLSLSTVRLNHKKSKVDTPQKQNERKIV